MIHLLHTPATHGQLQDMLEVHRTYVKVAVDVRQGALAGGGEFHADCQTVLLEEGGSYPDDVWGADWYPSERQVRFGALINIRPTANNRSMELQDPTLRAKVEAIIRHLMGES